jgi:sugar phosphate isomerase/epimerase
MRGTEVERSWMTRRGFLASAFQAALAAEVCTARQTERNEGSQVRMFRNLGVGNIGVQASQRQAVEYAAQFGFQGVSASLSELATMSSAEKDSLRALLQEKRIVWGPCNLPVEFRRDEDQFAGGLAALPEQARMLRSWGVARLSTWIMPGHESLTYRSNFDLHRRRLAAVSRVLMDEGLRLGLEFVGPKTSRARFRFPFIHTQVEMLELVDAIGLENVGLLLDSWHWHTSGGDAADLDQLTARQVVDVHVNDAPSGVPIEEQQDNRRALPCTSGIIDLRSFMRALVRMGYDGPVTCEPFDRELNALDNEAALKVVSAAMDRLFGLIET